MHGKIEMVAKRPVDTREPITVWQLLIWAYRRQMVHHAACDEDDYDNVSSVYPRGYGSAWNFGSLAELGILSRGDGAQQVKGASRVHPDAYVVHRCVQFLPEKDRELIVRTAENAKPPVWDPVIPQHRVVPVRKGGTGKIRMICGSGSRPIACMIDYEGVSGAEAEVIREAARDTYAHWWRTLRRLRVCIQFREQMLARWIIAKIGAPRQPW